MRKFKWLLPLALFVPLLMAPSGGYPVNPQFQSVTIAPIAGTALTSTVTTLSDANFNFNNTNTSGPFGTFYNGASLVAYVGSALNIAGQGAAIDFGVRAGTGSKIDFWSNGHVSAAPDVQINTAGQLLNSGIPLLPIAATLASDSTKSSNTTQALDATLQFTLPAAGTYLVELSGPINEAGIATGAGGFAGCLQFSGTVTGNAYYGATLYVTNVAFSTQWLVSQSISSSCSGGSQVIYTSQVAGGTSLDYMTWRGALTVSTSGTFGLSWAQSSSSATATTLKAGMTLIATRVL